MRFGSALSLLGACCFAACSFPGYEVEPAVDPLASVCTDGLPSDAESGIDCGGGCPPCGMGQTCRGHQDCESLACANGTCQMATCGDGVKNGAEADKDCGGQCTACMPGSDCKTNEDCLEGVCQNEFCQVPTCSDLVQNGSETSADCGNSCGPCENGDDCALDQDCKSQHCSEGVCVAPGCTDGLPNNDETDTDCGGQCGPCGATKHCAVGEDCLSLICDSNKVCTAYSCDDNVLNGEETALDCGGSSCKGCDTLEHCEEGGDCKSGACQSSRCVPATPTGVELSRMGWDADASESYPDDNPDQVLDSDRSRRWTSGTAQYDGMWFEVDMGQLRTFFSIQLFCEEAPLDIAGKFDLYLSGDHQYGAPTRPGLFGKTVTDIDFDTAQVARYMKFVVRQEKTKWLSIDEIKVLQ